jgi:hypothetical protein
MNEGKITTHSTAASEADSYCEFALEDTFDQLQSELNALKDILDFRDIHVDNTVRVVSDDLLEPLYKPGDYVGGTKCFREKINHAINTNCIVETKKGQICIGLLRKGSKDSLYCLTSACESSDEVQIFQDAELSWASPITWHLKQAG